MIMEDLVAQRADICAQIDDLEHRQLCHAIIMKDAIRLDRAYNTILTILSHGISTYAFDALNEPMEAVGQIISEANASNMPIPQLERHCVIMHQIMADVEDGLSGIINSLRSPVIGDGE